MYFIDSFWLNIDLLLRIAVVCTTTITIHYINGVCHAGRKVVESSCRMNFLEATKTEVLKLKSTGLQISLEGFLLWILIRKCYHVWDDHDNFLMHTIPIPGLRHESTNPFTSIYILARFHEDNYIFTSKCFRDRLEVLLLSLNASSQYKKQVISSMF